MNNLEMAQTIYDAFERGDIMTVLAGMDPEIEWREAEGNPYQLDGSVWLGPQAVVDKLFLSLGNEWDGFTLTVHSLDHAAHSVLMQGRYTGRYKPTGRSLDAQACHVLRFRNGKLVGFQQYCDTAQLQAVMKR
jgi:ketosteroid isomerase-like protein